MDHLPPTVTDRELLGLLGRVLETNPSPQSTMELRLNFFRPDFSWQALVDLAVAHEILPPLILSLERQSLLPPLPSSAGDAMRSAHVKSRLAAVYEQHRERQRDLRQQLHAAIAALNAAGIVPLLLKGAVHLTMEDGDWHDARGMRDLDILTRVDEAEAASRVMLDLGYRSDSDPPPLDRHLPELWSPGRAGTIEIHTEALSFNARPALTTEEVWNLAKSRSFRGASFMALPAEWHLFHGVLHHQLADRGHARRMLALKGLWEFAMIARDLPPDAWGTIATHAKQRGIAEMLASWAIQANGLFGLQAPRDIVNSEAGLKHAEATLARAATSYRLRQILFVADKLRFAFAADTLALRYGGSGPAASAAIRHLGFLWRRRSQMARRWFGG